MRHIQLGAALLRSRFGRRMFGVFVLCSLLPTFFLALVSFGTVTRQLSTASQERLAHTGSLLARGIADRLDVLDEDLARVPGQATSCPVLSTERDGPACDEILGFSLSALLFVPDNASAIQLFGRVGNRLTLDDVNRELLAAGRSLVVSRPTSGLAEVYIIRRANPRGPAGWLVGLVNPDYLLTGQEDAPMVPGMVFHVVDEAGHLVLGTPGAIPEVVNGVVPVPALAAPVEEWHLNGTAHVAVRLDLPAGQRFTLPDWSLVVAEPRSAVIAPLLAFRKDFLLIVAFGLAAALLLSLRHLQRSLAPLKALHEGTRRVARRRDRRVVRVRGHVPDE